MRIEDADHLRIGQSLARCAPRSCRVSKTATDGIRWPRCALFNQPFAHEVELKCPYTTFPLELAIVPVANSATWRVQTTWLVSDVARRQTLRRRSRRSPRAWSWP